MKLIGVLNYENGETVFTEEEQYDAAAFLRFLQNVLEHYPEGTITLILDNARIHHAKLIQPFLSENKRLSLAFLPPYSPNLNLIEGLWKWLKTDVIANVFYSSVSEIRKNVQAFLAGVTQVLGEVIDLLCIKM